MLGGGNKHIPAALKRRQEASALARSVGSRQVKQAASRSTCGGAAGGRLVAPSLGHRRGRRMRGKGLTVRQVTSVGSCSSIAAILRSDG
jgi:hypothetical protein